MIANDDPETLRSYRDQQGFEFPILLDPGAETIHAWGLFNDADPSERLIPHPTVVIVDRAGTVQYLFVETNYRLRPPTADLVERLQRLEE